MGGASQVPSSLTNTKWKIGCGETPWAAPPDQPVTGTYIGWAQISSKYAQTSVVTYPTGYPSAHAVCTVSTFGSPGSSMLPIGTPPGRPAPSAIPCVAGA